ncbi:MAG: nicotinic acid mononucleotide adenylyltransferase [Alphaproteobacteria bacterium]|nr:nicotinic acid mononucleotide adenylyltransferase [Alphaproteobacteria bacterium]
MRVGLLGGTFFPAHEGHLHISDISLKYFELDAVWWLVTPGNPLKSKVGLPCVEDRIQQCRGLVGARKIVVSDLESQMGTNRSFDSISGILQAFPRTEFIWLAGTDIAHEFHKWHRWQELIHMIPFAFVGRPTTDRVVRNTVFHSIQSLKNEFLRHGGRYPLEKNHIYWILDEARNSQSSTSIRAKREPKRG